MYSVRDLSLKVNELSRNSAENLLEIGSAFLEAKNHLSLKDYTEFLKETHYVEKSSTIRKWERIGAAYMRLKAVSNKLPPVFTTVYKLSQLSPNELDVLIKNNILNPSVTTKAIDAELNPQLQSNPLGPPLFVTLEFDPNIDVDLLISTLDELVMFDPVFAIKLNPRLDDYVKSQKSNKGEIYE